VVNIPRRNFIFCGLVSLGYFYGGKYGTFFFFFFRRPNSTSVVKTGAELSSHVSVETRMNARTRERQKVVVIPLQNVIFSGLDPLAYLRRKVRNVHSFGVRIPPNSHVAMRNSTHMMLKLLTC